MDYERAERGDECKWREQASVLQGAATDSII